MNEIRSLVTSQPAPVSESVGLEHQPNEDDDEVLLATLRQEMQREKEQLTGKTSQLHVPIRYFVNKWFL